ncbi:unnamed protein product [Ectocarpus sp. CCAP 1310/34]|nr:unnamed protein product [Ectocarpus sp. CCAP 1310/34]
MRCPSVVLVVASASLPCARGFLRPSIVARRRAAGADASGGSGDMMTCSRRSHTGGAAAAVVGRRGLFMMAEGRLTDDDLDNISLDPSTLDESELQRVEGIRAIQSKMVEVDEKKLELRRAARKQKEAAQDAGEGAAALKASAAGDDGMAAEERQRAEGLASIERSLAEVTAIQRQLGINVDEDEDEKDLEVMDTAWRGQAGLDVINAADGSRDWSDLSARRGLAVGDAVALTMFAYVGRASHGMAAFDLGVLLTALPFLIGWLAVSPLLGAYTRSATETPGGAAKALLPAWGISIPVGIFLRALSKGGEVPPVPFAVTSMIFTLAALMAWRQLYTAINPTGEGDKQAGLLDGFRMITTLLQRW